MVDVIKDAIPAYARRSGGHPAKKSFQAIRVAVNNELGVLQESLEEAIKLLRPGGRISVITFSLTKIKSSKRSLKSILKSRYHAECRWFRLTVNQHCD